MRRAAKVDANHSDIVEAFRCLDWYVLDVSKLKKCCDLFVSKRGTTIAIEVKDGAKPRSARRLTEGEEKFKREWQGRYEIVLCISDVVEINKSLFTGGNDHGNSSNT